MVRIHSYQECVLPTELCGPVCTKLYRKSILAKSQLTVPVRLWEVTYMLNRQISGEISRKGAYRFDGKT